MTDYQIRELIKAVKEISIEVRNLRKELMKQTTATVKDGGDKNVNGTV